MLKKILSGIGMMMIGAFTFLFLNAFNSSLAVRCDLQNDQLYTCRSSSIILGITLLEVNAEQVNDIERDLTCKGAGPNRGCSAHAEFITATGETITLSKLYTDPGQVQKMVNELKPLMADKATSIDIVFSPSTFMSVVLNTIGGCVFILFLLIGLIFMFGKDAKDLKLRK